MVVYQRSRHYARETVGPTNVRTFSRRRQSEENILASTGRCLQGAAFSQHFRLMRAPASPSVLPATPRSGSAAPLLGLHRCPSPCSLPRHLPTASCVRSSVPAAATYGPTCKRGAFRPSSRMKWRCFSKGREELGVPLSRLGWTCGACHLFLECRIPIPHV